MSEIRLGSPQPQSFQTGTDTVVDSLIVVINDNTIDYRSICFLFKNHCLVKLCLKLVHKLLSEFLSKRYACGYMNVNDVVEFIVFFVEDFSDLFKVSSSSLFAKEAEKIVDKTVVIKYL